VERDAEWAALMRAGNAGDAAAYRRLLAALAVHFRGLARRGLARYGQGTADVEDLVQEMLLAVHLKRATWRDGEPLMPWLAAIARYKLIDHLRRRGRRAEVALDPFEEILAAEPATEAGRDRDVETALASLPAGQQAVVRAIGVEGAEISETADKLGLSAGAVRVAFHRGLTALRRRLQGGDEA
jgi:RNA polymerase sigma-70 factor (ECF subfamily)